MVVDDDYDGVRIGNEMTQEFIDDMTERFKTGKKIHRKYVYQIILAVKQIVYDEATMVEMKIPDDVELTVCGDTHGSSHLLAAKKADRMMANSEGRTILRSHGALQAKRHTDGQALVPLQWRLRRQRVMVYRDCAAPLRLQVATAPWFLPKQR